MDHWVKSGTMTEMPRAAIQRARERLVTSGLATPERISGCSAAELEDVQRQAPARLPAAYRAFLAEMGRSAGHLLDGSDVLYPELLTLRGSLASLLEETGAPWRPAATHFVFAGHQGYQFLLFELGSADDPAVLRFTEGDGAPTQVSPSFSEWLTRCVEDEVAAWRCLGSTR